MHVLLSESTLGRAQAMLCCSSGGNTGRWLGHCRTIYPAAEACAELMPAVCTGLQAALSGEGLCCSALLYCISMSKACAGHACGPSCTPATTLTHLGQDPQLAGHHEGPHLLPDKHCWACPPFCHESTQWKHRLPHFAQCHTGSHIAGWPWSIMLATVTMACSLRRHREAATAGPRWQTTLTGSAHWRSRGAASPAPSCPVHARH